MSDAERREWGQAPRISHWIYESSPGQIMGCGGDGQVLMAIAANPLFGSRLAAAFDAPFSVNAQAGGEGMGVSTGPQAFRL